MKLNKSHEIWKAAPWHVKISVMGVPSMRMLYFYAYAGFFIGLLCFIGGIVLLSFVGFPPMNMELLGLFAWSSAAMALASCSYLFAIIWVKDNPDCLSK